MTSSDSDLVDPPDRDVDEFFRTDRPLTDEQQIGRRPIIEGLADRLLQGEKKKLFEGRKEGKTTVARAAVRRIRNVGGVDVEVNLAIYRDPASVANELASQLAAGLSAPQVVRTGLRRLAGALSPAREELGDEAAAILDVVGKLTAGTQSPARVLLNASKHAKRKMAVLLDEAHVIGDWPVGEQQALGAALRDVPDLGVVITSSESRALERLSGEGGPLQYVGDRFLLPDIAEADWRSELARRFARLGIPILPGALDLLLKSSKNQPYCTMLLARESAISAIGVPGDGGRCSETHIQAGLLVARRDEAWDQLI